MTISGIPIPKPILTPLDIECRAEGEDEGGKIVEAVDVIERAVVEEVVWVAEISKAEFESIGKSAVDTVDGSVEGIEVSVIIVVNTSV